MKKVELRKTSQSSNYVKSVQQNKQVAFYRVEKYELSDVETTHSIFKIFSCFAYSSAHLHIVCFLDMS